MNASATPAATLDAATIDAIAAAAAERTVELLRGGDVIEELIDAAEVARRLGVNRNFVYAHANELGARSLGSGRRARLRFDPAAVADFLAKRAAPIPEQPKQRTRRRVFSSHPGAELLPIRGTGR